MTTMLMLLLCADLLSYRENVFYLFILVKKNTERMCVLQTFSLYYLFAKQTWLAVEMYLNYSPHLCCVMLRGISLIGLIALLVLTYTFFFGQILTYT